MGTQEEATAQLQEALKVLGIGMPSIQQQPPEDADDAPEVPEKVRKPAKPRASAGLGDGFVPPSWYKRLQFAMFGRGRRGANIYGPPGAGKTFVVRHLARASGIPYSVMQCAAGMTIEDLLGSVGMKEGSTTFADGPLAEAIRRSATGPAWFIAEEPNFLHPGVLPRINTLIDGSGDSLRLPNGETLTPNTDNFKVVLAYNSGAMYAGTRDVSAALLSRLVPIEVDYLTEADETKVLQFNTDCDQASALRLAQFANNVRAARTALMWDITPRHMCALLDYMAFAGVSWREAFEGMVLEGIGDKLEKRPQREAVLRIAEVVDMFHWPTPQFGPNACIDEDDPAPARDLSSVAAAEDFTPIGWRTKCTIAQSRDGKWEVLGPPNLEGKRQFLEGSYNKLSWSNDFYTPGNAYGNIGDFCTRAEAESALARAGEP